MDDDIADRLARIEEKLDAIAPHFCAGGSMDKLLKLRTEFDIAKKILGGMWAALIAYLSVRK